MIDKNSFATKLLWVDLEMTGLDVESHVILEVAAEITDFEFNTLASFEAVINQSDEILENMDPWCIEQHTRSGLVDRVKNEGLFEQDVVKNFVEFIKTNFGEESVVLAGNSIYNDRKFIKKYWPSVEELLHYRMLDVSSFKILMQSKYNIEFEKNNNHRAYDDIRASIDELEFYIKELKS